MHIQSIGAMPNRVSYNTKKAKTTANKVSSTANHTPFKGYNDVFIDVLGRDLKTRLDVARCNSQLFSALMKERNIQTTPEFDLLHEWAAKKITFLVEELCKPTPKMLPELRDIVYKSRKKVLPLVTLDGQNALFIQNDGKFGLFGSLFDSESAKNDTYVAYKADAGHFFIGMNSVGDFKVNQEFFNGVYQYNLFPNALPGERLYKKVGRAYDTSKSFDLPIFV